MTLHPDVEAFADLLQEIEAVLSGHGVKRWAQEVAGCLMVVERLDAHGVRRFLSLFGGLGSLNDIQIHRDGQPLTMENHQFHLLLTRAYEAGRSLIRDD